MNKYRNTITYSGRLTYNQDAEYELDSFTSIINISKILDSILDSNSKYIEIKVMNGCKLLCEEQGNLMKYKSYSTGVVDYHINGCCLGDILFDNTESYIDIEIYVPKIALEIGDRYSYGREQTSSCAK